MRKLASKEDIEDLRVAEHMRDLIASPMWKVYERLLLGHLEAKRAALEMPLHPIPSVAMADGVSHVLVAESAKGAIMGLRLALTLPASIVAGAEQIRKRINPSDAEVEI